MNPYDPAILDVVGKELSEVKARLKQELDAFEAQLSTRTHDWNTTQKDREWSPAQEAEHVLKVNSGVTKVMGLLLSNQPVPEQPKVRAELHNGKRISPPHLVPSTEGLPADWQSIWAAHRRELEAIAEQVHSTPERTFWHPYLGELDAFNWLRMVAGHMYSHRLLLEKSAE